MSFFIKPLLICVLHLVGTSLAGEWCRNTYEEPNYCANAYCCGQYLFKYCCTDCTKRYPKPNCPDTHITNSFSSTMSTMRITWIVIGGILVLKGLAALIYFCCCRRNNRRSPPSRSQPVQIGVPVITNPAYPGQHIQVDCPPSYDDLVKDGVLNVAYDHQCEGGSSAQLPETSAPHPATDSLPPPPPYCVTEETASPVTAEQPSPLQLSTLPSQNVSGATPQS